MPSRLRVFDASAELRPPVSLSGPTFSGATLELGPGRHGVFPGSARVCQGSGCACGSWHQRVHVAFHRHSSIGNAETPSISLESKVSKISNTCREPDSHLEGFSAFCVSRSKFSSSFYFPRTRRTIRKKLRFIHQGAPVHSQLQQAIADTTPSGLQHLIPSSHVRHPAPSSPPPPQTPPTPS
jgi:hypothetical protein